MKQERVILSFIMVLIGLLVAGATFYFYQSSKKISQVEQIASSPTPAAEIKTNLMLEIYNPQNEDVVTSKTITLSGKTNSKATVVVITKSDQQVLNPDSNGKFSIALTLDNDQNLITIISILPTGESKKIQETVTYSTSNF